MLPNWEGCSTQISSQGGEGTLRTFTDGVWFFMELFCLSWEDAHRPPFLSRRAPIAGGCRSRVLLLLEDENVSVLSPVMSSHSCDEFAFGLCAFLKAAERPRDAGDAALPVAGVRGGTTRWQRLPSP